MRSMFLGYVIALTVGLAAAPVALAQPAQSKKGAKTAEAGDKTMDKQMEWEKKVMGDDGGKAAEMRKIANAQKLAEEAAKHPAPVQAPKPKDPNKEGVRAKQEASIGLAVAEEDTRASKKHTAPKKSAEANSANDELGALVASSLAEEKTPAKSKGERVAEKGKGRSRAAPAPTNSLDQMFATSKD